MLIRPLLILSLALLPALRVSAEESAFALTLDEVAALIDKGDEESLEEAGVLVAALEQKVEEANKPRVDAYAARLLMAKEEFKEALARVQPHIEDRDVLRHKLAECYFTAGLIHQAMAYRESPDSNNSDGKVSFMGLEVEVEEPTDDDQPLVDSGLEHAIDALNLFSFIASNAAPPLRIDALDQAGQTLLIMHEWEQAAGAFKMALDQTAKAEERYMTEEERETRTQRYTKRLEQIAKIAG